MQHEVLSDEACSVYAVNCQVEGSALHCGALYLEPLIPHQFIRLADNRGSVEVELPVDLLNRPEAYRAWTVTLHVRHE